MTRDPLMGTSSDDPGKRPRSGWRWDDEVLNYRVKFVGIMAIVAVLAFVGYTYFQSQKARPVPRPTPSPVETRAPDAVASPIAKETPPPPLAEPDTGTQH